MSEIRGRSPWVDMAARGELVTTLRWTGTMTRHFADREVRATLAISSAGGADELLGRFVDDQDLMILDRVDRRVALLRAYYRVSDGTEHCYHPDDRAPLLTSRVNEVATAHHGLVTVSRSSFVRGPRAAARAESKFESFVGPVLERRVAAYLVDSNDRSIYSAAATVCEFQGRSQARFELEYHGTIAPADSLSAAA